MCSFVVSSLRLTAQLASLVLVLSISLMFLRDSCVGALLDRLFNLMHDSSHIFIFCPGVCNNGELVTSVLSCIKLYLYVRKHYLLINYAYIRVSGKSVDTAFIHILLHFAHWGEDSTCSLFRSPGTQNSFKFVEIYSGDILKWQHAYLRHLGE